MYTVEIKEGLGDCLIAGAVLQTYSEIKKEKIGLITNPILKSLFEYHPKIQYLESGVPDKKLQWASTLKRIGIDVYPLHTVQRFSMQLGFMADPTITLNIYDKDGQIICNKKSKIVCVNTESKEPKRRCIPNKYLNYIESQIKAFGYTVVYIGNCGSIESIRDINKMVNVLRECKLFIGPVSFPYHLASALKCASLTFFSYMPYWKFSDFINTTPIFSRRPCVPMCEQFEDYIRTENNCWDFCKAIDYNENELITTIRKLL